VLSEAILGRQAVKRMLEPSEVADAAAFLLGPAGLGFTGAVVPMDHGWTAG
jgi:3-hydroxybutyrate dehydrogenase